MKIKRPVFLRGDVRRALAAGLTLAAFSASASPQQTAAELPRDLTDYSLEALLNIELEVTSVSKRPVPLREAPAAVFALSGEEIRRSGVRTIADALRMAPGLLVVRITAQSYIVTARGFPGEKLEVFVDGRSIYTPLTSIVFWDVLDTYLPDIDRIEVVRGPGAILTLWGANAMNGVVNIVTKASSQTAGTEISGGAGNEERVFGAVRTGARIGDKAHARLYVQTQHRDSSICGVNASAICVTGQEAPDSKRQTSTGFRSDWDYRKNRTLILSGDVYTETAGTVSAASRPQSRQQDTEQNGGNLTARWNAKLEHAGELAVLAYYANYFRFLPEIFRETRDTYNLELEHRWPLNERHRLVWGLGARSTHDVTGGRPLFAIFDPPSRTLNTYAAAVQDQIRLFDHGELTIGSKFEHNEFTGFETQPGIRLGWKLGGGAYTWGSIARAVRTPNRLEDGLLINCIDNNPCPPAESGSIVRRGNTGLKSEKLVAYDWGLRLWREDGLSADLAVFFNDYSDLRSSETAPLPFGTFGSGLEGESYGAELALGWPLTNRANLQAFYNVLEIDVAPRPGSTDTRTEHTIENSSPKQSAGLRLSMQPRADISVDGFLRYVGRLSALAAPAYTELNLRLAWRPWPEFELALVGENLLDPQHPEHGSPASATSPGARPANEMERSVFAEFRWIWQ